MPGLFGKTLAGDDIDPVSTYFMLDAVYCSSRISDRDLPGGFWAAEQTAWAARQGADGGWGAIGAKPEPAQESDFESTAAGLLCLELTDRHITASGDRMLQDARLPPKVRLAAMTWLAKHGKQEVDRILAGKTTTRCREAFFLGRLAEVFGYCDFAKREWIDAISHEFSIVPHGDANPPNLDDAPYALLFVANWPKEIVASKLALTEGNGQIDWNDRWRDALGLLECDDAIATSQVIYLDDPIEKYLDVPTLFICGPDKVAFTEAQIVKLGQYVRHGGLIVACTGPTDSGFDATFAKAVSQIFPSYQMTATQLGRCVLGDGGPFAPHLFYESASVIGNHLRSFVIWQRRVSPVQPFRAPPHYFARGIESIRTPQPRPLSQIEQKFAEKRTIRLARLEVVADADPEPELWTRLAPVLSADYGLAVEAHGVMPGRDDLSGYDVARLSGFAAFKLTAEQRNAIHKYIESGGTLMVDAVAGSNSFADSAAAEIEEIFGFKGAVALTDPTPLEHPAFAWMKSQRVEYSHAIMAAHGELMVYPRIRAIIMPDGHIGVMYSREDLAGALLGMERDNIYGYTTESARQIVGNFLRAIPPRK